MAYVARIHAAAAANDATVLKKLTDDLLAAAAGGSISPEEAKAAFMVYADASKPLLPAVAKDALTYTAESLRSAGVAVLDEPELMCRMELARTVGAQGDDVAAAQLIQKVPLENDALPAKLRAAAYMRCIHYYMDSDNSAHAEGLMRKAGDLILAVDDSALRLQFNTRSAEVFDMRCKFFEATSRYMDIMRGLREMHVTVADVPVLLGRCCITAVLIPTAPNKQRIVSALARDEQIMDVPAAIVGMITKMASNRFISGEDVRAFEATLKDHHKSTGADGFSHVQRCTFEHNILSARQIYKNIKLGALADLCGVTEDKIEALLCRMIKDRRLKASLDQVDSCVVFTDGDVAGAQEVGLGAPGSTHSLHAWDAAIKETCLAVNACADAITRAHPTLAKH